MVDNRYSIKRILSTLRFFILHRISKKLPVPSTITSTARLAIQEVFQLTNTAWYHNFSVLGVSTPQIGGYYTENQKEKQVNLFPLIERAIQMSGEQAEAVKGLELFCADGFFSLFSLQNGAAHMVGVDTNEDDLIHARLMMRIHGLQEKTDFLNQDVYDHVESYSFCICSGGLYHISDPELLLKKLRSQISKALVIQTVFSLANENPDYFETPAPHLTWGCRFSWEYLLKMVGRAGWEILEAERAELDANPRPEDRGSAYLLCVPRQDETPRDKTI